ncbi:hypothetical protein LPJ53_000503 [Coemansia erecta]|uniref:Glycoside hydrolase 35 catalytic domain-containing protein n=1 Tax=Coemansia erecta TaxID=147472 RepID=A0A9W8CV16_9FUNG|nr:hypothetical protein LPJ53_000503 [Coemansia erecta]
MAGILLESGVVLVPLACAALYIIVTSNKLLVFFSLFATLVFLAGRRLRYHYSSGAYGDMVVRTKDQSGSAPANTSDKKSDGDSDDGAEFDEIIHDAHRHCDIDEEVVEGSGALLSTAVTTASTKFDMELYGAALSYDHRCFYIDGRPTWILAADFDYWRIPLSSDISEEEKSDTGKADQVKQAWRRILLQIKSVGFNAVRIRFHWGFHSPSKGKYDFTGGRDVHQLLTLCEELGVLVIACLGPYVGDDVQGGGYPFWLIQRDHIRLRHLKHSGYKLWDNHFAAAEAEWYDQIIPMIVGHEVVTKNTRGRGCVVLVQVENHLGARGPLSLPLALQDETRLLARMARERVIRTPLITNNHVWPQDFTSFAARAWMQVEKKLRAYRIIGDIYRTDLSGFTARDIAQNPLDIDSVALITKGDNVPMVAAELYRSVDGGSGRLFSEQIENALSQGLSAFSLPGFFGLSTTGNFASAALTTSPDVQCAAIGEDGLLSEDARVSRLVLSAARAFEHMSVASDYVSARPWITRPVKPAVRGVSIRGLPQEAVRVRRQWEYFERPATGPSETGASSKDSSRQLGIVTYVDGTKTSETATDGELAFLFSLADAPTLSKNGSFALTGTLGPRKRGMFVSNVFVGGADPLMLVAATKEIYARVSLDAGCEVWVCAEESIQSGQLFFEGECQVAGHAEVEYVDVEHAAGRKFSFVIPNPGPGLVSVTGSGSGSAKVYIALVPQKALDTLVADYRSYDRARSETSSEDESSAQSIVAWGADSILLESDGHIGMALPSDATESTDEKPSVFVVSSSQPQSDSAILKPVSRLDASATFSGCPFIWQFDIEADTSSTASGDAALTAVSGFEKRITSWDTMTWKLLPTTSDLETMDEINVMSWQRDLGMFAYNAIDVGLNASNVLYRCQVRLKPQHITSPRILLQLNARHRCTVWVNGVNMSGHETFHEQKSITGSFQALRDALKTPGAVQGPDRWSGTYTYDVTDVMRISNIPNSSAVSSNADSQGDEDEEGALNEVIVIVESYGLGTQSDGFNDARVPRGLIAAYWHGYNLIGEDHDDSEIHDHSHDRRTEQLRTRWEICGVDVTKLPNPYNSAGFPDETTSSGWSAAVEYPLVQDSWSTRAKINVDHGVHWLRWQLLPSSNTAPLYLRISGRATAYVWVNGVIRKKHRASSNGSSLVLLRGGAFGEKSPEGSATADSIVVMMYGWADHVDISANDGRLISVDLSLTNADNA